MQWGWNLGLSMDSDLPRHRRATKTKLLSFFLSKKIFRQALAWVRDARLVLLVGYMNHLLTFVRPGVWHLFNSLTWTCEPPQATIGNWTHSTIRSIFWEGLCERFKLSPFLDRNYNIIRPCYEDTIFHHRHEGKIVQATPLPRSCAKLFSMVQLYFFCGVHSSCFNYI